ncbi:MAG TPA: hypothetical protein VHL85_10045 [Burkholderiales bacterium]|nr:hypothetical protein [Burkholderiales bacterium]
MRSVLAALALAMPALLCAQEASKKETAAVQSIVECLIQGLPEEWQRAEMTVELAKPGAQTGDVEYIFVRAGARAPRLDARPARAAARREVRPKLQLSEER